MCVCVFVVSHQLYKENKCAFLPSKLLHSHRLAAENLFKVKPFTSIFNGASRSFFLHRHEHEYCR